jgi:peptidoglycan-associated lipoprotein
MRRLVPVLALTAAALAGCSKKATTKVADPSTFTPESPAAKSTMPTSPTLGVTDDLAQMCKLVVDNVSRAPKFDYNDELLQPQDRDVLQQVATCLTTGPLKGRSVRLVGRADPRGTDEYNMGLGSRRATTVIDYLRRLGVESAQLTATTRGEIDATGADETGWREDRRVDLELVQ